MKYKSINKLLNEPDRIQYLKNDICNFRFLNPNHYGGRNKKNIITISFFKMDKHYKNFGIYMAGLDRWIDYMDHLHKQGQIYDKYVIRMFIDRNVYEDPRIMRKILSSRHIEPVLFTCHKYMKGRFHIDVFATLVRFFPAFDFPNNDSNRVISVDIDLKTGEDFERIDFMIRKSNVKNNMMGMVSIADFLYYGDPPHVFAGSLYTGRPNDKYEREIIVDFINNPDVSMKNRTKVDFGPRSGKYSYGVDEIFLNNYWVENVDKISSVMFYTPAYFLYHSRNRIMQKPYSEDVFRQIFGKYYKPSMSLKEMYRIFDNQFFLKRQFDAKARYITTRFYDVIAELLKKRKYWFEKRIMELVSYEFDNVILANAVFTIDNQNYHYTVKLYDVVTV